MGSPPPMPHSFRPKGQRETAVTRTQKDMGGHLRTCGLQDRNTATGSLRPSKEGVRRVNAPNLPSPCHHLPSTKQTEPPLQGGGQQSPGTESIKVQLLGCQTREGRADVKSRGEDVIYMGSLGHLKVKMQLHWPSVARISPAWDVERYQTDVLLGRKKGYGNER